MMTTISAGEVLNDIEFELIQSSVSRDDLGTGIQAVRQYQNSMRADIIDSAQGTRPSVTDFTGRQLQFNDLMLSLFQESSARLQALQLELRRAAFLKQHASPTANEDGEWLDDAASDAVAAAISISWLGVTAMAGKEASQPAQIEEAMSADALEVPLDMRPVQVPLIGGLLTRLRAALHSLSLFSVDRLASRRGLRPTRCSVTVAPPYGSESVQLRDCPLAWRGRPARRGTAAINIGFIGHIHASSPSQSFAFPC